MLELPLQGEIGLAREVANPLGPTARVNREVVTGQACGGFDQRRSPPRPRIAGRIVHIRSLYRAPSR